MFTDKAQREEYYGGYWLGKFRPADAEAQLKYLRDVPNVRQGIEDALDGKSPQVGVITDYTPTSAQIAPVPVGDLNRRNYLIGYKGAQQEGYDVFHTRYVQRQGSTPLLEWQTWLFQGMEDFRAGRPPLIDPNGGPDVGKIVRVAVPVPPPPPVVNQPPPPITPAPPLVTAKVFEVCAFTVFGMRLYIDQAYRFLKSGTKVSLVVSSLVSIEVLGNGIRRNRNGFELGGQNGPIADRISRAARAGRINPNPRNYDMPAWYGAQTSTGIRLFNHDELSNLGLLKSENLFFNPEGSQF